MRAPRVWFVDLARGAAERVEVEAAPANLGGVAFAATLLAGELPLPPPHLVIAAGPLPALSPERERLVFAARSPLTGRWGDSLLSGPLGAGLKGTGALAVVLGGRAPRWSVLLLDPHGVRLLPADALLGQTPAATEATLAAELGSDCAIAAIGVAGEREVAFASVGHAGRCAGRTGMGAVLGAQRLKAIAIRGERPPVPHDPVALDRELTRLRARAAGEATARYRERGTAYRLVELDALGALPTRNFQRSRFAAASDLYEATRDRRIAYEPLFAFGPLIEVADPEGVTELVRDCDAFGLDAISAGGTLAFAMECAERGIFGPDAGSLAALRFGDATAARAVLAAVATRTGAAGALIAGGTRAAATLVGGEAIACAMQSKGLELPGYDPRRMRTLALGLAVGARGACHNRSSAYDVDLTPEGDRLTRAERVAIAIASEDRAALLDSLIVDRHLRRCFSDFETEAAALLRAATGWDGDAAALRAAAARIHALRHGFNRRCGWSPAEDTLPARLLGGENGGLTRAELAEMVRSYHGARGM